MPNIFLGKHMKISGENSEGVWTSVGICGKNPAKYSGGFHQ